MKRIGTVKNGVNLKLIRTWSSGKIKAFKFFDLKAFIFIILIRYHNTTTFPAATILNFFA